MRFLRWLFSWRTVRRALIGLAWIATLIALYHGEENWRGWRAWNRYRRGLEAQGVPLDYKALIPKPVPDEQNFAATPIVRSWFEKQGQAEADQRWDDNYARVADHIHPPWTKGAPANRQFEDLAGWEAGFAAAQSGSLTGHDNFYSGKLDLESRAKAAPAVLQGLKTNEALFVELRSVSGRPYSNYPVNYDLENVWAIKLPHLNMVKGTCQRLGLQACAELAGGQSDKALDDVGLMLRLADSLKSDACLISYLVRLGCVNLTVQPIWEGLAERRWSEAQLQELEDRLQKANFIADVRPALDMERAAGLSTIELLKRKGPWYLNYIGDSDSKPPQEPSLPGRWLGAIIVPRGWYSQEALNYCRGFQAELATGLDITHKRISPHQAKEDAEALNRTLVVSGFAATGVGTALRHQVLARMLLPALTRVLLRAAAMQTAVNQAAIGCALERYRLAKGELPEQLQALAPQFIAALPNDVLTGEPYKYRRNEDGRFVLYSIGWDEKDEGGVSGKRQFDETGGDWVWEYPGK